MTPAKMREQARIYQSAGSKTGDSMFLIFDQIWLACAEICERLDRAAQPQELEK